ncbi:hypothetical protein XENTR_v10006191 [Xenopus tropicalis]|nr:hypothetical protein XENTR_v10006191 [Xenopus tropicalis]
MRLGQCLINILQMIYMLGRIFLKKKKKYLTKAFYLQAFQSKIHMCYIFMQSIPPPLATQVLKNFIVELRLIISAFSTGDVPFYGYRPSGKNKVNCVARQWY